MKLNLRRLTTLWSAWLNEGGVREDAQPVVRPFDDFDESPLELAADSLRRDADRTLFAIRRVLRLSVQMLLAATLGLVTGLFGGAFLYSMNMASAFFLSSEEASASGAFRMFLLAPFAGLFIVFLYKATRTSIDAGTNQVIESLVSEKKPSLWLAPLIFIGAVVTQTFGGSAGREGAAIQLGGCVGLGVGRLMRMRDSGLKLAIYCGMAGGFSSILGAPLTAAVFAVEVGCVGVMYYPAFLPSLVSSTVAAGVTRAMGFEPFFHAQPVFPATSLGLVLRVLALGLLCGLVSVFFCATIRRVAQSTSRRLPNDYVRVFFGGALLIVATTLLGTNAYNGTGLFLVERATQGAALPQDFLLKTLFTAVCLGAGYKGGEIVPALAVGSTFGCFAGGLLGLDPALGASLGMVSVFCGSTNCPLASLILGVEFFGAENALLFALGCAATYMSSGRSGLYKSQRVVFSKASDQIYDVRLRSRLRDDLETLDERSKGLRNVDVSQFKKERKNCWSLEDYLFSEEPD
ncbi:MAG: chloride channel protein [Thermoguttaceae bacterium]|nr:chloride channel protein [Thermoguttaceae bacterium]